MTVIAVTGGGGFIGSALVRALLARGEQVRILGRSRYPELERLGAVCCRGDIGEEGFVRRALAGVDLVYHVAARAGIWGPWSSFFRVNVQGTANVIRACREHGVRFLVHTSTPSVVFAGRDLEGVDESCPYAGRTLCHYSRSKIMAEKMVLCANGRELATCALRPHLVFGPGDPHLVPRLLARARAGRLRIVGDGRNRVDITYIDNAVQAHLLAADSLAGGTGAAGRAFFIGQEEPVFLWNWINHLLEGVGIAPVCRRVPLAMAWTAGAMLEAGYGLAGIRREPPMTRFVAAQLARSHWFDHAAAREVLGYRPVVSTKTATHRLLASLGREA